MTINVSDFLLQRLTEWGVKRIYGYPGDEINGLMGALIGPASDCSLSESVRKKWVRSWRAPMQSLRVK